MGRIHQVLPVRYRLFQKIILVYIHNTELEMTLVADFSGQHEL